MRLMRSEICITSISRNNDMAKIRISRVQKQIKCDFTGMDSVGGFKSVPCHGLGHSRFCRYCLGGIPILRLNVSRKVLGSRKPHSYPTRITEVLPWRKSSTALQMRYSLMKSTSDRPVIVFTFLYSAEWLMASDLDKV